MPQAPSQPEFPWAERPSEVRDAPEKKQEAVECHPSPGTQSVKSQFPTLTCGLLGELFKPQFPKLSKE